MSEHDEITVTLTLDNDEELECSVLTILQVGGNEYIALLPLDDSDNEDEDSDIFLYRYIENEDGDPELSNIEDDDEYELVADAFDEWLDLQDFEDLDQSDFDDLDALD